MRRHIPFAFVTGYDAGVIPHEFDGVERLEKPVAGGRVLDVFLRLLDREGSAKA